MGHLEARSISFNETDRKFKQTSQLLFQDIYILHDIVIHGDTTDFSVLSEKSKKIASIAFTSAASDLSTSNDKDTFVFKLVHAYPVDDYATNQLLYIVCSGG